MKIFLVEANTYNIHAALIKECQQGSRQAQYEIYKLYSKAMYNTAARIIGDSAEAEDILQESFVTCFTKIDQYRAESSFGAWLKRIVINNALTLLKKKQQIEVQMDQYRQAEDFYYEWEDVPEHQLAVNKIKDAMSQLPHGFRSVLSLYLFEGYDHKEIAEILGISESTSKSQLNRAKKKIRELVSSEVKYG